MGLILLPFFAVAFHDFVWKNGNVPIALQRFELLGGGGPGR